MRDIGRLPRHGRMTGHEKDILHAEETGLERHIVRIEHICAVHLEGVAVVLRSQARAR